MSITLPESVHIDAADGTVNLRPPTRPGMPWLAHARPVSGEHAAVLWRDNPELYLCVLHGYADNSHTACEHVWAAINARHDAEEQSRR